MKIDKHDIPIIVKSAWYKSFAIIPNNKKAIAERGWFPLNRNLLCHPEIVSKISQKYKELELSVIYKQSTKKIISTVKNSPTFDTQFVPTPPSSEETAATAVLNFSSGLAGSVMTTLFHQAELTGAREKIKSNLDAGKTVKERLSSVKKLTAGQFFKANSFRVGNSCFEIAYEKHRKKLDDKKKEKNKLKEKSRKLRKTVDEIKHTGLSIEAMNVT